MTKYWVNPIPTDMLTKPFLTFDAREMTFATIDHQHLSNIYYYWKYASPAMGMPVEIAYKHTLEDLLKFLQKVLDDRFNGQLLSYRPHIRFGAEIKALKEAGYLKHDGKIIIDGKEVGEINTMIEDSFKLVEKPEDTVGKKKDL